MAKTIETRVFDAALYLDDEEAMIEYLDACLEDPNPDVFITALGDVAKARGMSRLARDADLSRESLYKALSGDTKPRFETVQKITQALGLRLKIDVSN